MTGPFSDENNESSVHFNEPLPPVEPIESTDLESEQESKLPFVFTSTSENLTQ